MNQLNKEQQEQWEKYLNYAKNNGFSYYIGNLSFINCKNGDILTLISSDKVSINRKNSAVEAEFTMLEAKANEDNQKG